MGGWLYENINMNKELITSTNQCRLCVCYHNVKYPNTTVTHLDHPRSISAENDNTWTTRYWLTGCFRSLTMQTTLTMRTRNLQRQLRKQTLHTWKKPSAGKCQVSLQSRSIDQQVFKGLPFLNATADCQSVVNFSKTPDLESSIVKSLRMPSEHGKERLH